jgi:hypothetical protein
MILGNNFFITPSDSVAMIAANAAAIPYFKTGIKVRPQAFREHSLNIQATFSNTILGNNFFITPSDLVAMIAANAAAIPYFKTGINRLRAFRGNSRNIHGRFRVHSGNIHKMGITVWPKAFREHSENFKGFGF